MKSRVTLLLAPTASGKTDLSIPLAKRLNAEIIVCDSMQVYRGMDIGTGKPSEEAQRLIPHHLLNIREVNQSFSAGEFVELANQCVEEILKRGKHPLMVVGTPLYAKCFLEGLDPLPKDLKIRQKWEQIAKEKGVLYLSHRLAQVDPESAYRIQPGDLRRLIRALEIYELTQTPPSQLRKSHGTLRKDLEFCLIGLSWSREVLYQRINRRVVSMFEQGWVQEALALERKGMSRQAAQALGYKEILEGHKRNMPLEKIIQWVQKRTRQFARRQILWFQKFPPIHWIPLEKPPQWEKLADQIAELYLSLR